MGKLIPQTKAESRARRHARVRAKVVGTAERPRLAVFRSNKALYAQIIDDMTGTTLASASSLKAPAGKTSSEEAQWVGEEAAKAAQALGITTVVFDRGGFTYAGRVKALAEAARAQGLKF